MKTQVVLILMLLSVIGLGACKSKTHNGSSDTSVASIFVEVNGRLYFACNGSCESHKTIIPVGVRVCKNAVVTSLAPVFTPKDKNATVSPTEPQDFTTPKIYTVTAEDGTQRQYEFSVTRDNNISCD
ncbi:MAG: hypothetical protein LBV39_03555 [Bacteroidales bacterium]|jgi:hypothetical protein|nr:hypothetical protein [Bacteroidales bacterium]